MSSSLILKPTSLYSSRSSLFALSTNSRISISSVRFPRNFTTGRRLSLRIRALDNSSKDNNSNDSDIDNSTPKNRKDILLEYVKNVQPEIMELFVKRASPQVVEAMRQTVTNMIGSLPPQFFSVTVTTECTIRMELQQSLEQVALPEPQEDKDASDYAPGTQKKVSGEVIRWNNVSGLERIDAEKYIELLEAELEELNRQVARKSTNGQNELLDYMKSLEPQNLKELTSTAGEDVILAMNTFIKRLLAVSDPAQMKTSVSETSATELGKLLYWLMVVGYGIRNIEVRFDMEKALGSPAKLAELPPGEMI